MLLTSIEILNLWGEEKITLEFDQKVTFLTGINGCGKSSLLNIIYDTLNQTKDARPTSKNRFWSALAVFDNDNKDKWLAKSLFPANEKTEKITKDLLVGATDYTITHNFDKLKKLEQAYRTTDSAFNISHITDSTRTNIEASIFGNPDKNREFCQAVERKKTAFLFQEDRNHLHNQDNTNLDKSTTYWQDYQNSIDERFHYIRDKLQIHEAQANQALVTQLTSGNGTEGIEQTSDYKKIQAIKKVTGKLNQYFAESDKEITQDHNGKLTLKLINDEQAISWNLLSRGEKTLIYLFYAVHLYQDKVAVFLLDEPEIALHPKWQHNLIKDLSDLAPKKQFIIATHSPSLIKNGWLNNCLDISRR